MNLFYIFTTEEKELLENIGIKLEDRNYYKEELRKFKVMIEEFIMCHSVKNGDVEKYINQYNSIINKITEYLYKINIIK